MAAQQSRKRVPRASPQASRPRKQSGRSPQTRITRRSRPKCGVCMAKASFCEIDFSKTVLCCNCAIAFENRVILQDWSLELLRIGRCPLKVLRGMRCDAGKSNVVWRTSIIIRPLTPRILMTRSHSLVEIVGPLCHQMALRVKLPKRFVQVFSDGFPLMMWEKLLGFATHATFVDAPPLAVQHADAARQESTTARQGSQRAAQKSQPTPAACKRPRAGASRPEQPQLPSGTQQSPSKSKRKHPEAEIDRPWCAVDDQRLCEAIQQIRPSQPHYWWHIGNFVGRSQEDCQARSDRWKVGKRRPDTTSRARKAPRTRPANRAKGKEDAAATLGQLPARDGPVRARKVQSFLNARCFKGAAADLLKVPKRLRCTAAQKPKETTVQTLAETAIKKKKEAVETASESTRDTPKKAIGDTDGDTSAESPKTVVDLTSMSPPSSNKSFVFISPVLAPAGTPKKNASVHEPACRTSLACTPLKGCSAMTGSGKKSPLSTPPHGRSALTPLTSRKDGAQSKSTSSTPSVFTPNKKRLRDTDGGTTTDFDCSTASPGSLSFLDTMHTGYTPESRINILDQSLPGTLTARSLRLSFDESAEGGSSDAISLGLDCLDDTWQPKGIHNFICDVRARRTKLRGRSELDSGAPALKRTHRGLCKSAELSHDLRRGAKLFEKMDSSTRAAILAFDESPRSGAVDSDEDAMAPLAKMSP